ncbi:TIGR02680 family protein [Bhargavaea beijingensis]|uniref:TIGR02680 family protein n=1 Tax=Bhargavaea beijingensis TaxID=426756 RepID=A0A1G7A520_9BACL|nr:TIGR02680 family protein [Bhargavaea beijingensis]SDE10028.1 TIGR02680 family protein [Bhargavaea beijingensis]
MNSNRWVMHRAGLLNFWYYNDQEIFNFSDGKLLLRGANGSGKSVTMQSLLPVLLDGKKSPSRLDPFGSSARKMEDYLLGEKEISGRDERTGYLFLEYKKTGSPQYITTGIGLQARRGKTLSTWHFVIHNERIGHGLSLTKRTAGEDVPLSFQELKNRVGDFGTVTRSQGEYAELVRKHVFGFETEDAYDDLIKLLVQIRTPKLSKDFKPTVITGILESALPPLTDDELRHLSDTIDSMDLAQQQYDKQEAEYESVKKLEKAYHAYNEYILAERHEFHENARSSRLVAEAGAAEKEQAILGLSEALAGLEKTQRTALAEIETAEQASLRLRNHKVWNLREELVKKQEEAAGLERKIASLEEKLDRNREKERTIRSEADREEDRLRNLERDADDAFGELEALSAESAFDGHAVNSNHFKDRLGEDLDFTAFHQDANAHLRRLRNLREVALEAERKHEEAARLQRRASEQKQEVDELRGRIRALDQWFGEAKVALTDTLFSYFQGRPALPFSEDDAALLSRRAAGLYDTVRFEDVRQVFLESIENYRAGLLGELAGLKHVQKQNRDAIRAEKDEIERWKTAIYASPGRHASTEQFRTGLTGSGVPYIPLFAAVEFREEVSDEERQQLESALAAAGLLDALITDGELQPESDRVLRPEPLLMTPTLADYLVPGAGTDSPISAERIDDILRSIPLSPEEGRFHLDADGSYSFGILRGHAPDNGPSKYIGRTSRERHRARMIEEAEARLDVLKEEKERLDAEERRIAGLLDRSGQYRLDIPDDKALSDIHAECVKTESHFRQAENMLLRLEGEWKSAHSEAKDLQTGLRRDGNSLGLILKPEPLGEAIHAAEDYAAVLHGLDGTAREIRHARQQIAALRRTLEDLLEASDELLGEQYIAQDNLAAFRRGIESIEKQMELEGIEDIRREIGELQKRLADLKATRDRTYEEIPETKAEIRRNEEKLNALRLDAKFWTLMEEEWSHSLKEEHARGFITRTNGDSMASPADFKSVPENKSKPKLDEQLTKAFLGEQFSLIDYSLTERTDQREEPAWFTGGWTPVHEAEIGRWKLNNGRKIIEMDLFGKRDSPYAVAEFLSDALIQQQQALDEQERKLFEDIILHTVSNILRARIQRTEKWVREMDGIMKERNNSQGLIFSIKWKPLPADSEEELDTAELVRLLRLDARFMKPEDRERIQNHFRSRIDRAKQLTEDDQEGATMRQVLKEVLDYRKWFRFVLSYRKENEPTRELTDHAFNKFSGGEKAMAMYIPLFTAAYSRYKEAADFAPYVISLDEAFAGVDDTNIRDMFEVVEQLGFNYIMNSQALWGDYDTVLSLSVYELIRQKNADFVSTIRYEWNGREKQLITEEEPVVTNPELEEPAPRKAAATEDPLEVSAEEDKSGPSPEHPALAKPASEQASLLDLLENDTEEPARHGR